MKNTAGEVAVEHFKSGYNCAESVLLALAGRLGVESGHIPMIASGFGGGVSRCGHTCGAFTGAVMGMGLKRGRKDPADDRAKLYDPVQELERRFVEKFGGVECRALIGFDLRTHEGHEAAKASGVFEKNCRELVRFAADTASELMDA